GDASSFPALDDRHDEGYAPWRRANGEPPHAPVLALANVKSLRVRALNVYPVKSMKGIAVRSWPVGETGLVADRRWLVVGQRGVQVTQREAPRMCLIAPAVEPSATAAPTTPGHGGHDPVLGAGMASGEPALATGDLILSAPRAG